MMSENVHCYKCSKELELVVAGKISRHEECPHCYANMRSCKMCIFYSVSAYNECKEPMANRILEKESANFCDYFKLSNGKSEHSSVDPMAAAKALFKD